MATRCLFSRLLGTGNCRAGPTTLYVTIGLSGPNLGLTQRLSRGEPGILQTSVATMTHELLQRLIAQVQRQTELWPRERSTLFESWRPQYAGGRTTVRCTFQPPNILVVFDADHTENLNRLKELTKTQQRADEFERYVGSLFTREHFKVEHDPNGGRPRQIDLIARRTDVTYLVEVKWQQDRVDINDIDSLFTRLEPMPADVIGVFVSWSGFADSVAKRVIEKRAKPVVLVSGRELEAERGSFAGLLRWKQHYLLTEGKVALDVPEGKRAQPAVGIFRRAAHSFVDLDGNRSGWIDSGGEFGPRVFVGEIPDIDWVPGPGSGVSLDLPMESLDFVEILNGLSSMGWVSNKGRWCIQQASRNWFGCGADNLVTAIDEWEQRYEGVHTLHHTEEVSYIDTVADGLYSLSAGISADERRVAWHPVLSLQLSGVPVRQESIRHLCDVLRIEDPVFYRPIGEKALTSKFPWDKPLEVVGFVTEMDHHEVEEDEKEWACGVVARNPYPDRKSAPEWWPTEIGYPEWVVCSLRNWHPVKRPRSAYHLWKCEWTRTSEVFVARLLADWESDWDQDVGERTPSSVREYRSPLPIFKRMSQE
jgi:Restriction endonuclease